MALIDGSPPSFQTNFIMLPPSVGFHTPTSCSSSNFNMKNKGGDVGSSTSISTFLTYTYATPYIKPHPKVVVLITKAAEAHNASPVTKIAVIRPKSNEILNITPTSPIAPKCDIIHLTSPT